MLLQVVDERERDAARAGLERESIAHDAGIAQEARDKFGDPQAVGRARDLRRARNNLRRIADRVHFHHVVDVVALNLPRNAGERNQIVGDDDDVVGIDRIGQREAQRSAGGLAVRAVAVAEGIRGGRGDHRDVDVNFAILNRLPASAMRAQHAHAAHLALRAVVAQRAVHAAFDVMDDARFHQIDRALSAKGTTRWGTRADL